MYLFQMQNYSKFRNYQRFMTKKRPCGRHFRFFLITFVKPLYAKGKRQAL